ncbi:MAG: hypothetical protein ACRDZ4_07020 [Egibacteraceae bacterium]
MNQLVLQRQAAPVMVLAVPSEPEDEDPAPAVPVQGVGGVQAEDME